MKIISVLAFLLTGMIMQAQNKAVPTTFDRFVQRSGIEWAAYASDTFNFTATGFNLLLLNRLNQKQIKASLPVESRSSEAGHIRYTVIDSINHAFYGDNTVMVVDSAGEPIEKVKPVPQYDNNNFTTTEITQILYIEKGKLKSYIPFVTPMLPVYLSSGQYIGQRYFFTSSFNYTHKCKARKKSKLIFLSHTKRMLRLDAPADQLKTMYGKNLVETLWPAIIKNKKTTVFDATDNRRLGAEELNTLHSKEPVMVPVYDSIGNISRYEVFEGQATVPTYTAVELQQDWYYDSRKNKVFSFITGLLLYTSKSGTVPYLKVVFE